MKKTQLRSAINIILILWIFIWIYYAAFNWDVFKVKLNTHLGFATIGGYPFLFFFIFGLIILVVIKYINHFTDLKNTGKEKETKTKITLLEKDLEIYKLKEVLFNMQASEANKNAETFKSLQEKLDEIAGNMPVEKQKENKEEKAEEKEKPKDQEEGKNK